MVGIPPETRTVVLHGHTYQVTFDPFDCDAQIRRLKELGVAKKDLVPGKLPWGAVVKLQLLMQQAAFAANAKKFNVRF
jgi:hypothetical protein